MGAGDGDYGFLGGDLVLCWGDLRRFLEVYLGLLAAGERRPVFPRLLSIITLFFNKNLFLRSQ